MRPLAQRISNRDLLLLDGAMGTQLMLRGLSPGECPEAWNLTRPEMLTEISREYVDAGADIVETNTFGASPLKLAQYDLADKTAEINEAAVRAAREAVAGSGYVAGSCGPCGRVLLPHGDTNPEEVYAAFLQQMQSLIGAGVDAICVETMTDLVEARLAVRAAKEVSPGTPVLATMTFDATPRGFFTMMGVGIEQAVHGLREVGADAIGSNCGNGIEDMVAIARQFQKAIDRNAALPMPLIIQSNAGLPVLRNGAAHYTESPELMAESVVDLVGAGVSLVGGCCGTTPDHIRAMREKLDTLAGS